MSRGEGRDGAVDKEEEDGEEEGLVVCRDVGGVVDRCCGEAVVREGRRRLVSYFENEWRVVGVHHGLQ